MPCDPTKGTDVNNVRECTKIPAEQIDRQMVHMAYKWFKAASDAGTNEELTHMTRHLWNVASQRYCGTKKTERLKDKLNPHGSRTCKDLDVSGSVTKEYCRENDRLNPRKGAEDAAIKCTQHGLGEAVWRAETEAYCKKHPNERYCSCYNVVEGVCDQNSSAAGCKETTVDPGLADEDALGQSAYDTLVKHKHCRAAVCQPHNYQPKSAPACPDAIRVCDKTFPTGSTTNSEMIRHCVLGKGEMTEEELEELLGGDIPELGEDWTRKTKKKSKKQEDTQALLLVAASSLMCCFVVLGFAAVSR